MVELKMWLGSNLYLGVLRLVRFRKEKKDIPYLREKIEEFKSHLNEEDWNILKRAWWGRPFIKLDEELNQVLT